MAVVTGPQRNSLSVEVVGSADHQGVRLDFGGEAAPLADDVAIKLVLSLPWILTLTTFPECWSTWSSFCGRRLIRRKPSLTQSRNRCGEATYRLGSPSSGTAWGMSVTLPASFPTFAIAQIMARRLTGRWWSSCTVKRIGVLPNALAAARKYAAEPISSFQAGICLVHDHGVHSDAGDHREMLGRVIIDSELDQIDRPGMPGEGDLDRRIFLQREVEVAREEIGGTGGHQPHRYARASQAVGDDPDRTITAGPDHEINLGSYSFLGHATAGVIG
jgi:hypothetical protein